MVLQEYWRDGRPQGHRMLPVARRFYLLHVRRRDSDLPRLIARGIAAQRPIVGNGLWVTSVWDLDGYRLDFESPTELPEETIYSDALER